MNEQRTQEPDYGNWVSTKLIYVSVAMAVFLLCLSSILLLFGLALVFLVFVAGAVLSIVTSFYFAFARYKFSSRGGNVQAQIEQLVSDRLDWNGQGQVLDIGCGNAPLTIMIAKKYPNAHVTGIDFWGRTWEYSKTVCERNAEIEGVADRVKFQKASAAALPFEDGHFDVAVSNLVFHEVKDAKDKREVIREALRVTKKEGRFVFQDLFSVKRTYGEVDDLLKTIQSWGIERVEFEDTSHSKFIPKALRLPFMIGTIGIIYGEK